MEKRLHDFLPEIKDYYTITDEGLFYSDNSGLMKTRNKGNTDYQIINFMREDDKKKTYRAHRLVLMAFNPVEKMEQLEVNHIDGNKKNNSLSNLEWVTSSENQQHAYRTGLQKSQKGKTKNIQKRLTPQEVDEIRAMRQEGISYKKIATKIGTSVSNVAKIVKHKTWNK